MRRSNILHLIPSLHQGGSERQALQLIGNLVRSGRCNVDVACLEKRGVLLDEVDGFDAETVPEFPLTSFYDANTVRQLTRFVRYMKERSTEIIQTHDFYTNIFGIAAARVAGVPVRIAAKRETAFRTRGQNLAERRIFAMSTGIVANSEAVKNYLVAGGVPAEKIEVVYNGIDIDRFEPRRSDRQTVLSGLGLPGDEGLKIVSIVANLRNEVKNHAMFIRAAARVSSLHPECRFVIAGEGDMAASVRKQAAGCGIGDKVIFTGRCIDVPGLLAASEVCVLTSNAEGFANAILEYMAAGKPVVATRVGGAAEAIVEGETGFLVPPDDDEALAAKIVLLVRNETMATEMGSRGRNRVAKMFSAASQLERILDLYERELKAAGLA